MCTELAKQVRLHLRMYVVACRPMEPPLVVENPQLLALTLRGAVYS